MLGHSWGRGGEAVVVTRPRLSVSSACIVARKPRGFFHNPQMRGAIPPAGCGLQYPALPVPGTVPRVAWLLLPGMASAR